MVGASRERVNKAISLFVRLGWLELEGRNHYRILDRDGAGGPRDPVTTRAQTGFAGHVEEREHTPPGVGGVVGAVGRALGHVDEAVLRLRVDDDLAVGSVPPRLPERLDVGRRRERVLPTEDRERRAHLGDGVERLPQPRPAPVRGEPDHPVERRPRDRSARSPRPSTPACRPCRSRARTPADVVLDDEEVGGASRSPSCSSSSRLCTYAMRAAGASGVAHLARRARERLRRAHREAVRGQATAEVVEQRAHAHDVGVQDEARPRHALGAGVDRIDLHAVDAVERDPLVTVS